MDTKKIQFGTFARFRYGKMPNKARLKGTGQYPVFSGYRYVGYYDEYNVSTGQLIIVARGVGGTGDVKLTTEPCFLTNLSIAADIDLRIASPKFLYYYFSQNGLRYLDSGSAQSQITISDLEKVSVQLPSLEDQLRVEGCLGAIDDKIRENEAINHNLQQQADAIFAHEFLELPAIPHGWTQGSLLDIANYQNGLAMQKYRPKTTERGIPVLKIKELRQGVCDDASELCSESISPTYIVQDGDVIFSWSGTLLVDFWCGGVCGLNQHLFKVTSDRYEKWFYYAWTRHHLQSFIAYASAMATTMGHIKRGELEKAEVLIPSPNDLSRIGSCLMPIYDAIISNRIENHRLIEIRDSLLPKLMSGEIDVSEVEL